MSGERGKGILCTHEESKTRIYLDTRSYSERSCRSTTDLALYPGSSDGGVNLKMNFSLRS